MTRLFISFIVMLWSINGYCQLAPDLIFTEVDNIGATVTVIANDGSDRLFLGTKGGKVFIKEAGGDVNPNTDEAFLDLTNHTPSLYTSSEGGLLGLAFHPDYHAVSNPNKTIYVYYTGGNITSYISKFTVDENAGSISDYIDESQEINLISFAQPQGNHNGGSIQFGKDGYLYIASGDGGKQTDPDENAQNINNYLGKILRIDVDGNNKGNYGVPASNPYVDMDGLDENWVIGLRNPWRISFDKDGDFWVADVGQNSKEEVTLLQYNDGDANWNNGANFGWNCFEGFENTTYKNDCPTTLVTPVFDYDNANNGGGASITGGYVYEGSESPAMLNYYFFADFVDQVVYGMKKAIAVQGPVPENQVRTYANTNTGLITTFGVDVAGEIYAGNINGEIYKISSDDPLSVELVHFEVIKNDSEKVKLHWKVEEQDEVLHYEIEHSQDGKEFVAVGKTEAKKKEKNYEFIDQQPSKGLNYYRLKMIHKDNKIDYSNTIQIRLINTEFKIFPNPTKRKITVEFAELTVKNKLELHIFNSSGQLVYTHPMTITSNTYYEDIILPKLPTGVYTVDIIADMQKYQEQLIIE